jgi:hypothetical protein
MTIFDGHTAFIWQVKGCTAGLPANSADGRAHILSTLAAVGLRTPFIKVADNASQYNLRQDGRVWRDDILSALFDALHQAGRPRIGWHYIYGRNPIAEADRAAERIKTLGLDGYVLDPEVEYKKSGAVAARQFMRRLRQLCPNTPLALCTYRFVSQHRDFPWMGFLNEMDISQGDAHMPQVYWMGAYQPTAGAQQVAQSCAELRALEALPVVPVGAAWGQRVGVKWWEPTAEQMHRFAVEAVGQGCKGVSWWSWDKLQQQDSPARGWWAELTKISQIVPTLLPSTPPPAPVCPTCGRPL